MAIGTQGNENNQNIYIILWIYDSEELREELWRDYMVDRLNYTDAENDRRKGIWEVFKY